MNIHGFITLTLLDYPEHLAASVFLGSCNLRCPFCQNGNLVLSPENEPSISEEEVLAFLKKRSGIIEGVCISGGEPTLYRELPDFISKIKALGYLVKLDTNGTNPEMLRFLYENHLLDYIAMDIKTQPEQYAKVSGLQPDAAGTQKLLQNINLSKEYIMSCGIDYEFLHNRCKGTATRKISEKSEHGFPAAAAIICSLTGNQNTFLLPCKIRKAVFMHRIRNLCIVILKFLKRQFQMWNCAEKISSK